MSVGYSAVSGCRVMSFRTVNKNSAPLPPPLIPCRLLFSFLFLFFFPSSPSTPLFHQFYSPSRKNIYFRKNVCARARIFLLFHRSVFGLLFFFPAKRNQEEEGGEREDFTGGREDRIVNDTARYNDKSLPPRPYANGRNYKRRAGCSVIILTFNCSIPRDK